MKLQSSTVTRLISAVLILTAVSCSKDRDDNQVVNNNQNGSVRLQYLNSDGSVTTFEKSLEITNKDVVGYIDYKEYTWKDYSIVNLMLDNKDNYLWIEMQISKKNIQENNGPVGTSTANKKNLFVGCYSDSTECIIKNIRLIKYGQKDALGNSASDKILINTASTYEETVVPSKCIVFVSLPKNVEDGWVHSKDLKDSKGNLLDNKDHEQDSYSAASYNKNENNAHADVTCKSGDKVIAKAKIEIGI